jgi:aminoglycoside phosphotransferase (APT) family kinase protein
MERIIVEPFDDYGTTTWMNEGTPQLRETVTRNLITAIAQYNALPVLDVLGPALDNVAELRRWRSMADEAGDRALIAVFDELEATPAPATGPPGLVHGDAKFSNMLWDDGTVAGVLDIEMSFNGDPAWDLGYVLAYFPSPVREPMPGCGLPGMIDRETVLGLWEHGTGRSALDIAWYEAASMAKIAAILTYGGYLARTGKSSDERMLGWPDWSAAKLIETKALMTLIGKSKVSA